MAPQSLRDLLSAPTPSSFALQQAPAPHRQITPQLPSSAIPAEVRRLAASMQLTRAKMSSTTTTIQSQTQPTVPHVPTYTPNQPGLYLQLHIDYGWLAAALIQQMASAQMQPFEALSVPSVQHPSFSTAQQTLQRQPSMAPFAAPPSVMRDVQNFVPSNPTLPPFTSQLGPRSATPTSSISPPEAAINRDEIVRLIKERL